MKKRLIYIAILIGSMIAGFSACSDNIDPVVEELEFGRLMAPTNLEARVINRNYARLSWAEPLGAESYTLEIYADSLGFGEEPTGAPAWSRSGILPEELPLADIMLDGETQYTARVQAFSANTNNSKWNTVFFETDVEQSLNAILPSDLTATTVTLHWQPGLPVTNITLMPGNINHVLTENEKATGEATITGLTTSTDFGNATLINPGDDIVALLNAAAEGAEFVIAPDATYTLGKFSVKKSVKISYLPTVYTVVLKNGDKNRGTRTFTGANAKPVLTGSFELGAATVAKLELNNLVLDGGGTTNEVFVTASGSTINNLTVNGCEIRNYVRQLIYNNNATTIGDVLFFNCIIRDIPGDGGDGIDIRGGTFRSLTVENTTFANGFRTFLRMQVACTTVFNRCTFYKIANFDNSNNHGLFRVNGTGAEFTVTNCLFVQTGVEAKPGTTMGNFCRNEANMSDKSPTYSNNYIWSCYNLLGGFYTTADAIKATEADPGFVNAPGYDFTVTNDYIKSDKVGDPRWLE
ncbi:MAG: fibronectin type III domain-containing protein [Culturomica sp.]|jgi:hypothetical protein|nr:fibronectin type III domain-containing protein [Culturomica sp.]